MPKIVTVEQMQALEAAADKQGHPYSAMMDLAGQAVAERALLILSTDFDYKDAPRVVVLVGPGHNGGDGLVAARYLKETLSDAEISAYLLQPRSDNIFQAAKDAGVFIADAANDLDDHRVLKNLVMNADILIDALFGTGMRLPIEGAAATYLHAVHSALNTRREQHPRPRSLTPTYPLDDVMERLSLENFQEAEMHVSPDQPYIIAVDAPTGLNCDTGELDELALHADETVTFGAAKLGQVAFPGADAVGLLHIAGIGLPAGLNEIESIQLELSSAESVARMLPPRPRNSHKGTFGKTFIVAGSINYIGAAAMCAQSAYRVGTGLVTCGVPNLILPALAGLVQEATWVLLPHDMGMINKSAAKVVREEAQGYSALLIGPGLGNEEDTHEFMTELLQPENAPTARPRGKLGFISLMQAQESESPAESQALPPMIIDADGLNLLAKIEHWWKLLPPGTIITPHPGEFGRLAGLEVGDIQSDRVRLAQEKAKAWNVVVVLKGAFTVVASPDGRATISPFASASLATAGTGDVLAGAIAGLRAQGLEPYEAAVVGVWIHGWAGTHDQPTRGNIATDVIDHLPTALEVIEEAR